MKKSLYIFLSFVMLGMISCKKDFLNRPPVGVQTEESFFKSPGAAFKTVVKCYQSFNDAYGYEAPRAELGNMATDDSEKGGSDAGDRPFVTDLGYGRALSSNPSLQNYWSTCYLGIGNCNIGLGNLPLNKLLDDNGYELKNEVRDRYIGEMKFLRAYLYFELVRVFGGVPLVQATPTVNDSKTLVRASASTIFKFIITNFEEAAVNLPATKDMPAAEQGRASREAALSMQARVYLYFAKDDPLLFEKARAAAKKVIDQNVFSLAPEFQDLFLADGYKTREPVFSIIKGDNPALNIYGAFTPIYTSPRGATGAYGFDQPTKDLVNEFEAGDPRLLFTVIEPGDVFPKASGQEVLDFSSYPSTGFHNRKSYLPPTRRGAGWGDDAWTFHPIRYADVLLMYAEALLQTGGSKQEVANNINLVRRRASNSRRTDADAISRVRVIQNIPLPDVKVSDDLFKAIKHERRTEFAMEYQRLYDLQRWNSYIETMNNYATKPSSNGKGAGFKKGINELFPIPQAEIDRSGNVTVQNPGY